MINEHKEQIIIRLFEIGRLDVSIRLNDDHPNDGIFYEITDFKGSVLHRGDERYFNQYPSFPFEALREYRKLMHTIELSRYNKMRREELT